MKNPRTCVVAGAALALALVVPGRALADGPGVPDSVTVSFGYGLNTALSGPNPANHHIVPQEIRVREGGVVNIVFAGFHWMYVMQPGVTLEEIQAQVPAAGPFIFPPAGPDPAGLYWKGLTPANAGLGLPATASPTNAVNRTESVSFPEAGTYLMFCNIRPHFLDGMWAVVKVIPRDK